MLEWRNNSIVFKDEAPFPGGKGLNENCRSNSNCKEFVETFTEIPPPTPFIRYSQNDLSPEQLRFGEKANLHLNKSLRFPYKASGVLTQVSTPWWILLEYSIEVLEQQWFTYKNNFKAVLIG